MAIHGKSGRFYKDGYDLGGQSSAINMPVECPSEEVTCFGDTWQDHVAGIPGFTVTVTSFWREASGSGTDAVYRNALAASGIFSWYPAGTASGDAGYGIQKELETAYSIRAPVGGAVVAEATFRGAGTLNALRALAASTSTVSASTAAAGYDYSASAVSQTSAAYLHVTAIVGTDPSVAFVHQESGDNVTYSDLFTVGTVTAIGATRTTTAASVNRYHRLKWTPNASTTSISFVYGYSRTE